jgi:hypothetical protein
VANALVQANGTVSASNVTAGSLSVTRTAPGRYAVTITGLGNGCPLPSITPIAAYTVLAIDGGGCGGGTVSTSVVSANGQDAAFALLAVGTQSGGTAARARAAEWVTLP